VGSLFSSGLIFSSWCIQRFDLYHHQRQEIILLTLRQVICIVISMQSI
jgi:hypothetical protein